MDEGCHFGRVDLVHFSTHKHERSRDLLIIVLVQVTAEFDEPPQVGDSKIERTLRHIQFLPKPKDPLGRTPPVPFLDGLNRRARTVIVLLLEGRERCSLVQLVRVQVELWGVGVAHLHTFLLISIIFYETYWPL